MSYPKNSGCPPPSRSGTEPDRSKSSQHTKSSLSLAGKVKIITRSGPYYFQCEREHEDYFYPKTFDVVFLGDKVMVEGTFGSEEPMPRQLISYSSAHADLEELRKAFPDRDAVKKACLMHTRGILNKVQAKIRAKELVGKNEMDAARLEYLLGFLDSCNCAPVRAIEKLVRRGYADVIEKLNLYEESEHLVETSQTFLEFISALDDP